jgi:hypothetical protein
VLIGEILVAECQPKRDEMINSAKVLQNRRERAESQAPVSFITLKYLLEDLKDLKEVFE